MRRAIILVALVCSMMAYTALAQAPQIQFPADYRTTFTNYLSLDRTQNADQIMLLYANDIALKGVRETGEFPDGSILIGEVYKAQKDQDGKVIESQLGRRVRGPLALVAVMEKQKGWGQQFPAGLKNGDWDFAAFKPDGTDAKKDLNACRACHAPLTDLRHVFSYEHLK
ncbi:cytochrome P460 family protein [Candidatus Entotheonella palauensis]|uniref:cytochrome P460 family protein n=1 Tax=Candidatus Entotheonella palauensis TaxID=93172 RepID=UPI000B7D5857|nr:cytochrome P460 family protein [Candidatus Entotheonella palauensis]